MISSRYTYHSLGRVTEAQEQHEAPVFDLAIADEAHRTTGALIEGRATRGREVNFQEFHDDVRLRAHKRLYMTATPRLYTERSKGKLAAKGITVVDMGDYEVYGPELHRLPFAKAVANGMLSDYRVIVLGVNQSSVTPGLRRRLEGIETKQSPKKRPNTNDMTRVLGVSLAVNGVTEGKALEQPGKLQRTMAFANSIARSKWYAEALMESEVLRTTTRRMKDGRAMRVVAKHLDASATALVRNRELRALANAGQKGECHILSNVRLFTEGVDVPQLDAVAFIDPRDSQVDVVQAVGRVMRKAPGKRFGYIIIPGRRRTRTGRCRGADEGDRRISDGRPRPQSTASPRRASRRVAGDLREGLRAEILASPRGRKRGRSRRRGRRANPARARTQGGRARDLRPCRGGLRPG